QASTAEQDRRKAKEAQDTANSLRKRLEAFQEPFKGLSKAQMAEVLQVASKLQQENAKAKDLVSQQLGRNRPRGGIER
ncbi:MobV family relaxase, partial [Pseudomonas lurida]